MRKLIINGRYLTQPITGVQRYAREIVQALDDLLDNHPVLDVELISPRLNDPPPLLRNIVHRSVGCSQGHYWEQFELPWHVGEGVLFCPGNTAPVISLLSGKRVVVTVHDLSYLYFPTAYSVAFRMAYRLLIPVILRKANAIITVSNSERKSILEHYPYVKDRIHAVQNGGLPSGVVRSGSVPNSSAGDGYVLYVGSLSKRKNFPGMLEVACRLARHRGTRFVFVGGVPDGLTDSFRSVPQDVLDRIQLVGQVNDLDTLIGYYLSAACFFFPSFYEASPLPPIEAMACGCPVIASSIPSLKERCQDAALYCDPGDVDDMCSTLEQLLTNAELRQSLRERGYRQAERYSWENCAKATLDILDGCDPSS